MQSSNQEIKKKERYTLKKFFFSFIWLAVLLFVVDVLTKVIAYTNLTEGMSVKVPGFEWLFQFTLVFNTGAAWGFGGDNLVTQIILCLISYAAAIAIIVYYIKKGKTFSKLFTAILMICLAGDVGNLVDRTFALFPSLSTIYSKGVIDFIDITPLIPRFGIFNFADSCLVVGIISLLIYEIVISVKEDLFTKNKKKDGEN